MHAFLKLCEFVPNLHHSPLLPQPSAGQSESIGCQSPAPVAGSRTQARLSQDEHWPQQQCWPAISSYLQSSASRFEQRLPGEAMLHSDKRYVQQSVRQEIRNYKRQRSYPELGELWSHCPMIWIRRTPKHKQNLFGVPSWWWQNIAAQNCPVITILNSLFVFSCFFCLFDFGPKICFWDRTPFCQRGVGRFSYFWQFPYSID